MDKIFGEVDAVEAGEDAGDGDKVEALVYSHQEHGAHEIAAASENKKNDSTENVDVRV